MTGEDTRTFVPTDWIRNPTKGLFTGLVTAAGVTLLAKSVAKRVVVEVAGDVYLIPPKGTAVAGVLFFTGATAGQVIDQQHAGIGTSTTATVISQFN